MVLAMEGSIFFFYNIFVFLVYSVNKMVYYRDIINYLLHYSIGKSLNYNINKCPEN